jgi:hypothetical protein
MPKGCHFESEIAYARCFWLGGRNQVEIIQGLSLDDQSPEHSHTPLSQNDSIDPRLHSCLRVCVVARPKAVRSIGLDLTKTPNPIERTHTHHSASSRRSMADAAPAAAADRWPALESNAELMTDLLQRLLLQQQQQQQEGQAAASFSFADVFSLDVECLAFVPQPVHALVLAYASDAIKDKQQPTSGGSDQKAEGSSLVFIRQLPALDAACGTIALLHAAANAPEVRAGTGPDSLLGRFLALATDSSSSSSSSTPEAWGERLNADDALRTAHWYVGFGAGVVMRCPAPTWCSTPLPFDLFWGLGGLGGLGSPD